MTNRRKMTGPLLLLAAAFVFGFATPSLARQQSQNSPSTPPTQSQNGVSPSAATPSTPTTPAEREEMRGDIFMARKMYKQAIQSYQNVLLSWGAPTPENEPKKGFFQRLFGVFSHMSLPQDPKSAKVLDKIGIAYQQLGDIRHAETYYKRASETDTHSASPLNNLGTIEFGRKNYKNAIKQYQKAIKLDPTVATTFSNLGYAYLAQKQYKESILAFRQSVLLDPEIFQHRSELGSVVEAGGGGSPGLFYYTLAKTFAMMGNAEQCAHYLKMSRDEGYSKFTEALKDPAFKSVLKDPRVQAILSPSSNTSASKTN